MGGVVCNGRDVTDARAQYERLSHEASHDPLTQLLNRAAFEQYVTELRPGSESASLAVLLIDLDDFKPVNDRHGHHVGDALLIEVASRMRECFRAEDVVARLGGDEFVVLLPGATPSQAQAAADRVVEALRQPVWFDGLSIRIGASVGVAVGAATDLSSLLKEADEAMYRVKKASKVATMP